MYKYAWEILTLVRINWKMTRFLYLGHIITNDEIIFESPINLRFGIVQCSNKWKLGRRRRVINFIVQIILHYSIQRSNWNQRVRLALLFIYRFKLKLLILEHISSIYPNGPKWTQMNPNSFKDPFLWLIIRLFVLNNLKPSRFQAHLADKNTSVLNLGWGG